ncbi:MAG: ABC transporter ATP-binding protein [Clostridiales Family XIII bacterium]|jgi:ABC-2 type transport system ATP-binding protein|nr:ABC transporter ATP-binding protein [Clostridiales Family XIII bacterium]
MNALDLRSVSKSFGGKRVLDDMSFSVPEHCVFGFVGTNGAGKTTTMKMILGLLKADCGEIDVYGERVSFGATKTNRLIGYLPDVPEFYGYMRPKQYLGLCAEIAGLDEKSAQPRIAELLDLVGLSDANRKIGGFSRGMKQRLGVAQALIGDPKLLICDEPTSALDPVGRKEILDILRKIKAKTTVVFSTHILSDVERICDRVAVLNKGKIVLESAMGDLKLQEKSTSFTFEFNREIATDEILRVLRENNLEPIKYETAEHTIESLFLGVAK